MTRRRPPPVSDRLIEIIDRLGTVVGWALLVAAALLVVLMAFAPHLVDRP